MALTLTRKVSKKARLADDVEKESQGTSTGISKVASSSKLPSQNSAASLASTSSSNVRRSKRTRKCKGDIELYASSSSTIKSIKIQVLFVLFSQFFVRSIYYFYFVLIGFVRFSRSLEKYRECYPNSTSSIRTSSSKTKRLWVIIVF